MEHHRFVTSFHTYSPSKRGGQIPHLSHRVCRPCHVLTTATAMVLRTEESPVSEHFNSKGHTQRAWLLWHHDCCVTTWQHDCCGDRSAIQPRLLSSKNMGKQVDQNPGDLISFWNQPQGGFSMKPVQWLSVDPLEFYEPDWYQGYWLSQEVVIMY